jgi:hypothetical protein
MASHPRRCSMASEVRTELLNPIPIKNFKLQRVKWRIAWP